MAGGAPGHELIDLTSDNEEVKDAESRMQKRRKVEHPVRGLMKDVMTSHEICSIVGAFPFWGFASHAGKVFGLDASGNFKFPDVVNAKEKGKLVDNMQHWMKTAQVNKMLRSTVVGAFKNWMGKFAETFGRLNLEYDSKVDELRKRTMAHLDDKTIIEKLGPRPAVMNPLQAIMTNDRLTTYFRKNMNFFPGENIRWHNGWGDLPDKNVLTWRKPGVGLVKFLTHSARADCDVCKDVTETELMWGTWNENVCMQCLRGSAWEVSSVSMKFGILNLEAMGGIQFAPVRKTMPGTVIKGIDPDTWIVGPSRPFFLVKISSLIKAVGGVEQLREMRERTDALRAYAEGVIARIRAKIAQRSYEEFRVVHMITKGGKNVWENPGEMARALAERDPTKKYNCKGPNQFFAQVSKAYEDSRGQTNEYHAWVPGLRGVHPGLPPLSALIEAAEKLRAEKAGAADAQDEMME